MCFNTIQKIKPLALEHTNCIRVEKEQELVMRDNDKKETDITKTTR